MTIETMSTSPDSRPQSNPPALRAPIATDRPPGTPGSVTPVAAWDSDDDQWLSARRAGAGGSDIAPILDLSPWRSSWDVWAEKTGHPAWRPHPPSEVTELGHMLEPVLIDAAAPLFGPAAARTQARSYARADCGWQMCSPDAVDADGWVIECKTGGLASKGSARAWRDGRLPYEYELQARWNTMVMDAPGARVVALVGGYGLLHFRLPRDRDIEALMVDPAADWWNTYVDGDAEPPVAGLDNEALAVYWGVGARRKTVQLGGDAEAAARDYVEGLRLATRAEKMKRDSAARLKRLMGHAQSASVDGVEIARWTNLRSGSGRRFYIPESFAAPLLAEGGE